MPKAKSSLQTENFNPDYVRMYYEHQYERVYKHEEQSLSISNIVLTISAVIITFGFNNKQSFGSISILFLPIIIGIANLVAILYIRDRGRWISVHQKRAKRVLEFYISELYTLDKETATPPKKWGISRTGIQSIIHYLFIFIAIILFVIFSFEVFGVQII